MTHLEEKYGRLGSILAARADFGNNDSERELLYREAFEASAAAGDQQGMLYVAHSLADLYVSERWDRDRAAFWIRRLENLSAKSDESWFGDELLRIRNEFQSEQLRRRG